MALHRIVFKNREEWLKARRGIGGSDASSVLGVNPYKSNVRLWEEKKGFILPEDISDKPQVKYGSRAEEYLRALFKLDYPDYQVEHAENCMLIDDDKPFMHASLDGELVDCDGRKGILEIKTTEILNGSQWVMWNNRIPDHYFVQVLHYLLVTGYEFAILKAQIKTTRDNVVTLETKHYFIERQDVLADLEIIWQAEKKFWQRVESGEKPHLILPEI